MIGRGFLPIGSCSMINILISIANQNWTFRSKHNFGSLVSRDLPFKLNPVLVLFCLIFKIWRVLRWRIIKPGNVICLIILVIKSAESLRSADVDIRIARWMRQIHLCKTFCILHCGFLRIRLRLGFRCVLLHFSYPSCWVFLLEIRGRKWVSCTERRAWN